MFSLSNMTQLVLSISTNPGTLLFMSGKRIDNICQTTIRKLLFSEKSLKESKPRDQSTGPGKVAGNRFLVV